MHRFASRPTICLLVILSAGWATAESEIPQAVDKRLRIELFAEAPDLVTPIGVAADAQGRVLVIESHTHFRPQGYQGPATDRIRLFEDTDGDQKADKIATFFEGTKATMGIGIHPDNSVYVATRNEIFRLRDTDGDGSADERTPIARLETSGNYPHNGLSGFAFAFNGDVYFGFGENLGADYKLIGSDGATLAGGGEGGNIYRCNADGQHLARVATGFWNPFHLCFDAFGRLFAVDNDPDSRPPCRLLHIVDGGDYGYRFRNGRKGLHPFTAWNGELPGTLPMVAGTGEAPSGVLAYESDGLPEDYRGNLLVTSWGDHRIERYRLKEHGASFRASMEPVITGGENFRPVGIALAPDGSLFVSDWVDKSYELHGQGRLWRISSVDQQPSERPANPQAALLSPHLPAREQAARTLLGQGKEGEAMLRDEMLNSADERVRAVALQAVATLSNCEADLMNVLRNDASPDLRALAIRLLPESALPNKDGDGQASVTENGADGAWTIETFLGADASEAPLSVLAEIARRPPVHTRLSGFCLTDAAHADPFMRQAALVGLKRSRFLKATTDRWKKLDDPACRVGILLYYRDSNIADAHTLLPAFLSDPDPTVRFCAVQWVGEERLDAYRPRVLALLQSGATTSQLFEACLAALDLLDGKSPASLDETGADSYIARLLLDENTSDDVRGRALRMLDPKHASVTVEFLSPLLASADPTVQLEAIRTLRESQLPGAAEILAKVAASVDHPIAIRAEAIVGLPAESSANRELLVSLATSDEPLLREEALRTLQGADLTALEIEQLQKVETATPQLAALVARALSGSLADEKPPLADIDRWEALLDGPADAEAGERIFFHAKAGRCYLCHEVNGRGGRAGPDLSAMPTSGGRRRLLESILQPSKEIAPQFVSWTVQKTDGTVLIGMLASEQADGAQTYVDAQGQAITLPTADIEDRQPHHVSIMPEGLVQSLTVQELRDLLAYLEAPR